jgi:hypothetical protein
MRLSKSVGAKIPALSLYYYRHAQIYVDMVPLIYKCHVGTMTGECMLNRTKAMKMKLKFTVFKILTIAALQRYDFPHHLTRE